MVLPKSRGADSDHGIDLVDCHRIHAHWIYRLLRWKKLNQKTKLDDYLSSGQIERTLWSFVAGVLFADKKDDSKRLCIDCRAINKLLSKTSNLSTHWWTAWSPFAWYFVYKDRFGSRVPSNLCLTRACATYSFPNVVWILSIQSHVLRTLQCTSNISTYNEYHPLTFVTSALMTFLSSLVIFLKILNTLTSFFNVSENKSFLQSVLNALLPKIKLITLDSLYGMVAFDPTRVSSKPLSSSQKCQGRSRFSCLCWFYKCFVPRFQHLAEPMTSLLHKYQHWHWDADEQNRLRIVNMLFWLKLLWHTLIRLNHSSSTLMPEKLPLEQPCPRNMDPVFCVFLLAPAASSTRRNASTTHMSVNCLHLWIFLNAGVIIFRDPESSFSPTTLLFVTCQQWRINTLVKLAGWHNFSSIILTSSTFMVLQHDAFSLWLQRCPNHNLMIGCHHICLTTSLISVIWPSFLCSFEPYRVPPRSYLVRRSHRRP